MSYSAPQNLNKWVINGEATVCLKVQSEAELMSLETIALNANLPVYTVHDAGRTQVRHGSKTCMAIGPAALSVINSITGKLKLY